MTCGAGPKPAAKVSYYREVRPILQANCQGCHQPAKKKGGYVMTDFKLFLAGGDSEGAAVVPRTSGKEPADRDGHAEEGRRSAHAEEQVAFVGYGCKHDPQLDRARGGYR